jgi:histidinol phosphatase-like enzyme
MKILFLDIDGVLNSGKYIKRADVDFDDPKYQIDPDAVVRLNAITQLTGAVIVVSSTWRNAFRIDGIEHLDKLQECMASYGITGQVIGMTPDKPNAVRNRRGKEIQLWIDDHFNEIEKFVIIDDDVDMGRLRANQVKTLFEDGIEDQHVRQIVSILGMKD